MSSLRVAGAWPVDRSLDTNWSHTGANAPGLWRSHAAANQTCTSHPSAAPFIETCRPSRALPRNGAAPVVRCQAEQQPSPAPGVSRRTLLGAGLALGSAAAAQPTLPALANRPLSPEWEVVDLPIEKDILLLDVAFTGTDPNHGGLCARPCFSSLFGCDPAAACGMKVVGSGGWCAWAQRVQQLCITHPCCRTCLMPHVPAGALPTPCRLPAGQPPDAAGNL